MRNRAFLVALIGYLLGSFFGVGQVLGLITGAMRPRAAASV